MASMTTVLTEMVNNGNSRTYRTPTHSVAKPSLVIQKVKFPPNTSAVAEDSVRIVLGASDVTGNPLVSKNSIEIVVRRPANSDPDDVSAMLATFRDLANSDEFTAMITSQAWLK